MSLAKHGVEEAPCDVAGCSNVSERSLNIKQFNRCGLSLKSSDLRSVHLCKEHYRQYKKQTKNDREIDAIYD